MNHPVVRFVLFILYRFAQSILLLVSTTFLIFLLVEAVPNDNALLNPQQIENLNQENDDPIFTRYSEWLLGAGDSEGVLNDDFGSSFRFRRSVQELIQERSDATFELVWPALILSLFAGLPLGLLMGILRHGFLDQLMRPLVILLAAAPVFWVGMMLIYQFGIVTNTYPLGGRCDVSLTVGECNTDFEHLILPISTLAIVFAASIALYIRGGLVELSDLKPIRVLGVMLRFPTMGFAALLAQMLSALVLVEMIFSWPGIMRLSVDAVITRDYPVLVGVAVTTTLWIILAYFGFSVLYALLTIVFSERVQGYVVTSQPYLQGVAEEQARYRMAKPLAAQIIGNFFTVIAVLILAGVVFSALGADFLTDQNPTRTSPTDRFLEINENGHLLGTDDLGRDVFARLLLGGRNSLSISVRAAFMSLGIALVMGTIGGLFWGILAKPINLFVNLGVLTLSSLSLLILLMLMTVANLPENQGDIAILLGLVSWPALVPIIRAKVRDIRHAVMDKLHQTDSNEFFTRALMGGIVVAAFGLVYATATALLLEVSISFIGLGVRPPNPSWGNLLSNSNQYLNLAPHLITVPGVVITLTVFSLFIIAERIRDTFDFTVAEQDEVPAEETANVVEA